jgi:hypothetical protein
VWVRDTGGCRVWRLYYNNPAHFNSSCIKIIKGGYRVVEKIKDDDRGSENDNDY